MQDVDYCGAAENVHVFDGASAALQRLKNAGYKLLVITNQSGIGRGYFNEQQYQKVETAVARQLGVNLIDATYYCPHLPSDGCKCRKPSPELVVRAANEHGIDLARSYFVGDKPSDIDCGRNAGVQTILVKTGYGRDTDPRLADFVAENLAQAADLILGKQR
jgi:D-glycero-D-manno-heptose 1,7-bisphosphate phosphatase